MNAKHVDYDRLAAEYDRRFVHGQYSDTGRALHEQFEQVNARRIMEVGCGTGHWLEVLSAPDRSLIGVDYSRGMLAQAQVKHIQAQLVQGVARQLPCKSGDFDFVYCIHALHHFVDPCAFITEAHRILRPGGKLVILGGGPPENRTDWYVYQYFDGVFETDLERTPPWETVTEWLEMSGFDRLELVEAEHIHERKIGRKIFLDPFLQKHACSQLALLSERTYQEGLNRIESDLVQAEDDGQDLEFKSEISIKMLSGWKDY
jgi:ubiquinone/menaquinone biosynthesis C-methylase UbiE